jgi:threonine aldolase
MRFVSAQIEAMLEGDLWLRRARQAKPTAQRVAKARSELPGFALEHPVEANEVFCRLPNKQIAAALQATGAKFYVWPPVSDPPLIRLVCSFATSEKEVDAFVSAARRSAELKAS